jgi:hypothetical protein
VREGRGGAARAAGLGRGGRSMGRRRSARRSEQRGRRRRPSPGPSRRAAPPALQVHAEFFYTFELALYASLRVRARRAGGVRAAQLPSCPAAALPAPLSVRHSPCHLHNLAQPTPTTPVAP